jgi:prepilin-type N-terminal cleavage/methylation domain-containing protein
MPKSVNHSWRAAFTLVELLVVIAIIANVAFADGSVRFIIDGMDTSACRAIHSTNGGEVVREF